MTEKIPLDNKATAPQDSGNSSTEKQDLPEAVKFEIAIAATKFGKFNYCLFLLAIPGGWTVIFEVTTMSYVFPAAQCDLNLSVHDKGLLNAGAYLGMISSGLLWGFLCDTLGRKNILIITHLVDATMVIISGFSQSFIMLLAFKILGGFFSSGASIAFASYLLEFHSTKYRARVQMIKGIIINGGVIALPLLGWVVLPTHIDVGTDYFVLHSWNIYLFVCAVPSLTSGIIFIFMPESPKFLMSVGRNEEALDVFTKMYCLNTGKSKEEFPIKSLVDETKLERIKHGGYITANRSKCQALREGCQQIRPICFPPWIQQLILVCTIQSFSMLSIQSLRLWLPQIFQSISDYQHYNNGTADLCTMLEMIIPEKSSESKCSVIFSYTVYLNTTIVASVAVSGYIIMLLVINKVGKKLLLGGSSFLGGIFAACIYFAKNTTTVLSLSSMFLGSASICVNIILVLVVEYFPTTQRSITVSFVMVSGRIAAVTGNVIFPFLLKAGCAPPFFVVGLLLIVSSFFTVLLPNTELKPLE